MASEGNTSARFAVMAESVAGKVQDERPDRADRLPEVRKALERWG